MGEIKGGRVDKGGENKDPSVESRKGICKTEPKMNRNERWKEPYTENTPRTNANKRVRIIDVSLGGRREGKGTTPAQR